MLPSPPECLSRLSFKFDPVVEPEVCLELDEIKKEFSRTLSYETVTARKNEVVLYGSENSGKTHLLRHIRKTFFESLVKHTAYVDFRGTAYAYDVYRKLIHAFQDELLLGKLLDEISRRRDPLFASQVTDDRRFSQTSKVTDFSPQLLFKWLLGEITEMKGTYLPDNKTPENMRQSIAALLRSFYFLNDKTYPILFLDHVEGIWGSARPDVLEIISVVLAHSSFFLTVDVGFLDAFRAKFRPNATRYEYHEIGSLGPEQINVYLRDLKKIVVRREKVPTDLNTRIDGETLRPDTYPFTLECEQYIKGLRNLPSGILTGVLDKGLKQILSQKKAALTKKTVADIVEDDLPEVLLNCPGCGAQRLQMNVGVDWNSGKITSVTCNLCNYVCNHLLQHLARRMVLDTSALASAGISNVISSIIPQGRIPLILIPQAVDSELSGWEKRPEKRMEKFTADKEYRRLRLLANQRRLDIREGVGRKARPEEIAVAQYYGSIDDIILETAKANQASIVTKDGGMAMLAFKIGIPAALLK